MEDMFADDNWDWDIDYNKIDNFKNDCPRDIPDQLYSPHKMQDFPFNNNFDYSLSQTRMNQFRHE